MGVSDASSVSSTRKKKKAERRREAENAGFSAHPSVPHYAIWLEQVMRLVMDGSGDLLGALAWWSDMSTKTLEELAESGKNVRWDLKIGSALLRRAQGHLRQYLFLRQQQANFKVYILRGRQIMKLNMQKYKAEDHAQRYYDIQDLNAVKCVKDGIVGFLLRWDTVFLRIIPEAQAAYGERTLLYFIN